MAKQKNKTRKARGGFLLGLIVGIAIGAAAAALFIPSFGGGTNATSRAMIWSSAGKRATSISR